MVTRAPESMRTLRYREIDCTTARQLGAKLPRAMPLLALAVGLLAAHADAKTRHCAETIVNEALIAFDDYACVTDMKSCIEAGTCLAAGIEERRLCECYLQVGRMAGS